MFWVFFKLLSHSAALTEAEIEIRSIMQAHVLATVGYSYSDRREIAVLFPTAILNRTSQWIKLSAVELVLSGLECMAFVSGTHSH